MKIEGSLPFNNLMFVFVSQSFRTCHYCLKLIFRIFYIFHLLGVTNGTNFKIMYVKGLYPKIALLCTIQSQSSLAFRTHNSDFRKNQ